MNFTDNPLERLMKEIPRPVPEQAKAPARLPLRRLPLLERDGVRGLLLPAAENPEDFGPSWPEVRGVRYGRPGADPRRAGVHPQTGEKVVCQL